MRLAIAPCLIAGLCLLPRAAFALGDGSIGVYADPAGVVSSATLSIGVPRTLYVVARLEGRTASGFSGAEFRVQGLPTDWLVFVTPNPAATVVLGDPFRAANGTHRANIAFNNCISGGGPTLLYTAVVIPQSMVPEQDLSVLAGDPPTNPLFTTPIFTLCDTPNFTKIPAAGAAFHFQVRAVQDLEYAPFLGYDNVRGVQPVVGAPGDVFHFRVDYSNLDGALPPPGSPRLELDANGDGDALDAGEGVFAMSEADLDSTPANGKPYRYDVALPAPPGGRYRYRFTASGLFGTPVPGNATVWNDSLFVNAMVPDLAIKAENIRVLPETVVASAPASIFALIENLSDTAAENIVVRITDAFGNLIQERAIDHMGPHSATEFGCTWRFPDPGFQPISVRVDPANAIGERSEDNNLALHGVRVGAAAWALQISALPPVVHTSPASPFALQGHAEYPAGALPSGPMAAAFVRVRPSWEPMWPLRVDSSGDFAAVLTPPATPGTYAVTFAVSDGAQTDSVSASVVVTASQGDDGPHLPNLGVQIAAVLGAGCPANTAEVSVQVRNTGDAASGSTAVRILLDGVTEVAVVPVAVLPPGSAADLGIVTTPLPGAGLHSFTALVDPANAVHELRKDDNSASATVHVEAGCFDLALSEARLTVLDLCSYTTPSVSLRTVNRGCANVPASRVAAFTGGHELASTALPPLAPGASSRVEVMLPQGAECTSWTFVVDPEGTAGADCRPENNALSMPLCPGACPPPPVPEFPNFTVQACDLQATPNTVLPGSPTLFSAWIANSGARDATQPVSVRFRVDGVNVGPAVVVGPLPMGTRTLATASVPWIVDLALHELAVSIDGAGQEAPGADLDNAAVRALPWNLRLLPIPACPPGDPPMFSNCAPCVDDLVGIRAVLINDGLFVVDSATVEYRDDGVPIGTRTAHHIAPSQSCDAGGATVELSYGFSAGVHRISVVANPDSAILEPTHGDNTSSGEVTVSCAATVDLSASVQLQQNLFPAVGDTIRSADVTVSNYGSAPAIDVIVRVTAGGEVLCDLPVGAMPGHSRQTLRCHTPWVVTSPLCEIVVMACADPFDQIPESNENNNCGQTGLCPYPENNLGLYADVISIEPREPAPGETVTIRVGLADFNATPATCELSVEWLSGETWLPIGTAPLTVPADQFFLYDLATFAWVVPAPLPISLRFEIRNIVPYDVYPEDNVFLGKLPWFPPILVPVAVRDLAAESTADGVRIGWRCSDRIVGRFALERRAADGANWMRLPDPVPATARSTAQTYQYLDRNAPVGAQLEYRLVGVLLDHREEILGTLIVQHDVLPAMGVRLLPVRPQPFRAGSALEFSLPASRAVDLQVFDSAGRRVALLAQGAWPAGRHAVSWNGLDSTNRRVPTGVYFARLVSGSYRETRRLVLVR